MINYNVPFYPNLKSGTHCFQASLKMVLKYFWPKKNFTFKELEKITAKEKGMWTWTMSGVLWLNKNSFEVKYIEPFNYDEFAKSGKKYLEKLFGNEVADAQEKHSILKNEQKRAKEFIKKIKSDNNIPEIKDIKELLIDGFLIIVCLNSVTLNKKEGYAGHFVVVKGFNKDGLILHNPGGYPGKPNQKVTYALFEKAWAYPNNKAKNIIAIRYPKNTKM